MGRPVGMPASGDTKKTVIANNKRDAFIFDSWRMRSSVWKLLRLWHVVDMSFEVTASPRFVLVYYNISEYRRIRFLYKYVLL